MAEVINVSYILTKIGGENIMLCIEVCAEAPLRTYFMLQIMIEHVSRS